MEFDYPMAEIDSVPSKNRWKTYSHNAKFLPRSYARIKMNNNSKQELLELTGLGNRIIEVRGEELAEDYAEEIAREFRVPKTIDRIAHKYLRDDYKISPRTARRAVYHALEVLVAKKILSPDELRFIDPDPLKVKRPLYERKHKKSKRFSV